MLCFELSGYFDVVGIINYVLIGVDGYDYELCIGFYCYCGGNGIYIIDIYDLEYSIIEGFEVGM